MNALTTTEPTPTTNPCPDWCVLLTGHPYDSEALDGTLWRGHELQIGWVGGRGHQHDVTVEISAHETAQPDESSPLCEPARIVITGELLDATAADAVALSELLLRAAEQLRQIERGE